MRKQLSYSRYPSGEVSRLIYPNGTIVSRNYTARGQLQGVGWGAGSTSYVYLADGRVDYQANLNGVATVFGYNERGMISSVSHKNGGNQSLAYREYWRDTRDRITAWKRGIGGGPNGMEDGRGDRYHYDPEGQLDRAWYRARYPDLEEPDDPKRGDTFQYDELGNRMGSNQVASRGATTFARRNNGLNQYLSWTPSAIYHDDNFPWPAPTPPATSGNGVTMAEGWVSASFNALNQPMAIWSPAYPNGASAQYMWFGFDPLGRCVKRWVGPQVGGHAPPPNTNPATYYYHDGWNLVQEGSSGNNAARLYVHGGRVDEIVASQGGGEWRYHHYDARGHCIMLTDPNGVLREQYDYDAFGLPYLYNAAGAKLGASAQWGNRFLFTGREWLQDLRIYDFRNRMYQPELGRFLQPDPKQFEAGDYNLYRYSHNDPINKSDPFGLDTYQQNRELGGDQVRSNYNPFTHSFTFTTNPDGSIKNTYSWGNIANPRGWNLNQLEDIKAAEAALASGKVNKVGDSTLDPYVDKAFGQLNKKENEHSNPPTCKYEAAKLLNTAKELKKADDKAAKKLLKAKDNSS